MRQIWNLKKEHKKCIQHKAAHEMGRKSEHMNSVTN